MTNQQRKQKAIQEAYGEHWEQVEKYVNHDGWFNPVHAKFTLQIQADL